MKSLLDEPSGKAKIVFPKVHADPLFQAIDKGGESPLFGSLPNHFKAEHVSEDIDPDAVCAQAVQHRWRMLADKVWSNFLEEPVKALNPEAQKRVLDIWNRQIGTGGDRPFWEISWVAGEKDGSEDLAWLDRRKHWRSHVPPAEGGERCMMMSDWQELSGYVRARSDEREKQAVFWSSVRSGITKVLYPKGSSDQKSLELDEGERLCAPALVKRLFPLLSANELEKILGWRPENWARHIDESAEGGTQPRRNWPSTSYLSSVHWVARAAAIDSVATAGQSYADVVRNASVAYARAEQSTGIQCIPAGNDFCSLDGNLYYADQVKNSRRMSGLTEEQQTIVASELVRVQDAVKELRTEGKTDLAIEPGGHYAVIRTDGDRVGRCLRDSPNQTTHALADFGKAAKDCLRRHNAVPVYVGGDDVLALSPLEDAFEVISDLRCEYKSAFEANGLMGATCSGTVVFSHFHVPLRWALERGWDLLNEVAKEQCGRDSVAVALHRPGGQAFEWASTWDDANGDPVISGISGLVRHILTEAPEFAANWYQSALLRNFSFVFAPTGTSVRKLLDSERVDQLLSNDELSAMLLNHLRDAAGQNDKDEMQSRGTSDSASYVIREALRLSQSRYRDADGTINEKGAPLAGDAFQLLRFLCRAWRKDPRQ